MKMYNKTIYEKGYGRQHNFIVLPPAKKAGQRGPAVEISEKQKQVVAQNHQDIQDDISVGEIELEK